MDAVLIFPVLELYFRPVGLGLGTAGTCATEWFSSDSNTIWLIWNSNAARLVWHMGHCDMSFSFATFWARLIAPLHNGWVRDICDTGCIFLVVWTEFQ